MLKVAVSVLQVTFAFYDIARHFIVNVVKLFTQITLKSVHFLVDVFIDNLHECAKQGAVFSSLNKGFIDQADDLLLLFYKDFVLEIV